MNIHKNPLSPHEICVKWVSDGSIDTWITVKQRKKMSMDTVNFLAPCAWVHLSDGFSVWRIHNLDAIWIFINKYTYYK